jgi:hypothetical protein
MGDLLEGTDFAIDRLLIIKFKCVITHYNTREYLSYDICITSSYIIDRGYMANTKIILVAMALALIVLVAPALARPASTDDEDQYKLKTEWKNKNMA